MSPLLFSLFTSDLPQYLQHQGIDISESTNLKFLLYCDDLCVLADSPVSLQRAMDRVSVYTDREDLSINTSKTKCITFSRAPLKHSPSFTLNGAVIENVSSFTYLGVVFTSKLSAQGHIDHIVSKCAARIGYLHSRLPVKNFPLEVAKDIFSIYVLPIITYCLPTWFPLARQSSLARLDSVFSKYLKNYLGVPRGVNNALVHFLSPFCICLFCSRRLDRFHYRECGLFAELSPFGRMKKLKLL